MQAQQNYGGVFGQEFINPNPQIYQQPNQNYYIVQNQYVPQNMSQGMDQNNYSSNNMKGGKGKYNDNKFGNHNNKQQATKPNLDLYKTKMCP